MVHHGGELEGRVARSCAYLEVLTMKLCNQITCR